MSWKNFITFTFLLATSPCLSEEELPARDHQIIDEFGGQKPATREEYEQWLSQKRKEKAQQLQQQRQQQLQQQIQNQLSQMKGGGGGGGSGGGGGGGGGGGSKGGNSSKIQPLNSDAFGKMPDFSQSNKDLEKLVAESAKPDKESEKLLEELQKKMEEASAQRQSVSLQTSNPALDSFTDYIRSALASLQTRSLLNAARRNSARRVVGRPSSVPNGLGVVAGQSRAPRRGGVPAYRGLAGSTALGSVGSGDLLPRAFRNSSSRRPLTH